MRLDVYLSENGYASSRQKAKDMICAGNVFVNGVSAAKPAYDVEEQAEIEIRGEVLPYVGRGGYKLAGALDAFRIDPAGFTCVDIGASNKMEIVPNMILTMHPSVFSAEDGLLYGNTFVCTEKGAECLTPDYADVPYLPDLKKLVK